MTQELRKLVDRMEESDRLLLPKKDAQELLDRVEKAEKDAARLDWLEKHDKRYYNYDKISCIVGSGFSYGYISEGVNSTLRGAIDAAMEASK